MFGTFLPSLWKKDAGAPRKRGEADPLRDFFGTSLFSGGFFGPGTSPAVDITDSDEEFLVSAEIPGIDPKDIDLSVERGRLVIKGEKRQEKQDEKEGRFYSECSYGSFQRSIALPDGVKEDGAKADFKNGVLTVRFSKDEALKPKKIEITQ